MSTWDVKAGDKIRMTFEQEVLQVGSDGFVTIDADGSGGLQWFDSELLDVDVIEPAPEEGAA